MPPLYYVAVFSWLHHRSPILRVRQSENPAECRKEHKVGDYQALDDVRFVRKRREAGETAKLAWRFSEPQARKRTNALACKINLDFDFAPRHDLIIALRG